jgi:hypothetical protein
VRERIAPLPATEVSREPRGPLRTDRLLAEHGPGRPWGSWAMRWQSDERSPKPRTHNRRVTCFGERAFWLECPWAKPQPASEG